MAKASSQPIESYGTASARAANPAATAGSSVSEASSSSAMREGSSPPSAIQVRWASSDVRYWIQFHAPAWFSQSAETAYAHEVITTGANWSSATGGGRCTL